MKRLWQVAKKYKHRWFWGCFMLLLTNATNLAIPQLFKQAIDGIHQGVPVTDLRDIALMLIGIAVAGAFFRLSSRIHLFYGARDVELDLRCAYYAHLTKLPPSFFHNHPAGDLMSRATNDLPQVRLLLGPGLLNAFNTVVAYAGSIPLMLLISPKLTIIALTVYPPAVWLLRHLGRRLYLRNRGQQEAAGDIAAFVQENLAGAHVIRAFDLGNRQRQRFDTLNKAYYRSALQLAWVRTGMFRLVMSLAQFSVLLAVFFGAYDILDEELSLGELVALIEYMALLSWPTFALGWVLSLWQRGAAALSRIQEILDIEPSIASGPEKPVNLSPEVRIDQLSLSLEGRTILDKINLHASAGQTIGIVGPVGSGKSMLLKALVRLWEVPHGAIRVGDCEIHQLHLTSLRGMFGYVPQTANLFSRSLAENVAFGKPKSPRESIETALNRAAFNIDPQTFPLGLETPVGERGITLSGGQKQRTGIARALLMDPPILLLDDALSAVDAETETEILTHLKTNRQGRTTFIVAHRMSAVEHADHIIVLKEGRIVEAGTHDTLVAQKDGWYARMAERQALAQRFGAEELDMVGNGHTPLPENAS